MSSGLPPDHPSSTYRPQQQPQPQPQPHPQPHHHRDPEPPSTKRRRHHHHHQDPQSTHAHLEHPESSNAVWSRSIPTTTPNTGSQPRGASRETEMPLSSSPQRPSTAIKYTRTGRVSKAAKGQRVHSCEECGKTYTRAEHLRRHQQNHKPGAFPCDIAGCSRSFYREDLLVRHKARHNDPLNPPSRRASVESDTPGPTNDSNLTSHSPPTPVVTQPIGSTSHSILTVGLPSSMSEMPVPQQRSGTARYEGSMSMLQPQNIGYSPSLAPRKNYIPIAELPMPMVNQYGMAVSTAGPCSEYAYGTWNEPPFHSPQRYDSPTHETSHTSGGPYYDQLARARNISNASFYGSTSVPRSPSTTSSNTYMSQWAHTVHGATYPPAFNTSSSSESSYSNAGGMYNGFVEQAFVPETVNDSKLISAQDRDVMEQDYLRLPTGPDSAVVDLHFDTAFPDEERYLSAYWTSIHPLYPVIHKPTFQAQAASPLLLAAVLALGAQSLQNHEDMSKAKCLHERSIKVLEKRTIDGSHSYRVCDDQAIVLTEIYSIFKSRRPPSEFSDRFLNVYRLLSRQACSRNDATDSPLQTQKAAAGNFLEVLNQSAVCKQRLLATCYILDLQQATLFGRSSTEILPAPGLDLHFPKLQAEWDISLQEQADLLCRGQLPMPCYDTIYTAINVVPTLVLATHSPHDVFQSQLMMAYLVDEVNAPQVLGCLSDENIELSPILLATEQSARNKMTFHTLMLCKQTPIHDLLAVVGETWVMAEKLDSQDKFIACQLEAYQWAAGGTKASPEAFNSQAQVERAVYHATQILSLHRAQPNTGLFFQEWAVYLAAVVIWARVHILSHQQRQVRKPRLSLSMPHPGAVSDLAGGATGRLGSQELELSIMTLVSGGEMGIHNMKWRDTRNILLWAKAQLEKVHVLHICGLTHGALDVLGKLITRGNEVGWFGS